MYRLWISARYNPRDENIIKNCRYIFMFPKLQMKFSTKFDSLNDDDDDTNDLFLQY